MTETIINHASSKENRAKRLRILRKMCGLTRKDFSSKYAISASNFQNWEGPRYGGLTESAAIKFIDCIRREGIKCTLEWLMFGSGPAPIIMPSAFDIDSIPQHIELPQHEHAGIPEPVQKELNQFCHNHPNALALQIHDDSMSPYFQKGEILAGICYHEHQIATAIGGENFVSKNLESAPG